jgi:cytochrome b561
MSVSAVAPKSYSLVQKALHWIVAAMIIAQVVLHEGMVDAWRAFERTGDVSGLSSPVVLFHVWGGLAVLAFAAWRLALRKTHGVPHVPADEPAALKFIAMATHVVLYGLMILLPISGAAAYFGGIEAAGEMHELMKPLLIVLVGLHVAGALYQHFWLKTDVLKRMTHG